MNTQIKFLSALLTLAIVVFADFLLGALLSKILTGDAFVLSTSVAVTVLSGILFYVLYGWFLKHFKSM